MASCAAMRWAGGGRKQSDGSLLQFAEAVSVGVTVAGPAGL
jgi:hypothetical protein